MKPVVLAIVLMFAGTGVCAAQPAVRNPSVTGPIAGGTRGQAFGAATAADLGSSKFTEKEFFFGGSATSYVKDGTWGIDGIWRTKPDKKADFTVRMLVRRPADATRFNGVVVIE